MTIGNIILILVLVALNGFFVAVEFAAVSGRRTRLDMIADPDNSAARIARTWFENPAARERLIAACQLGITLASLALGAVGENTFEAWLEPYFEAIILPQQLVFLRHLITVLPLIIALTVVTSLHVVLGEQVPKVAALRAPERVVLIAAPVMRIFSVLFKYFVDVLDWATRMILKLIGLPASTGHSLIFSPEEFKQMVNAPEAQKVYEETEREILSAVIEFGDLSVGQLCIPRVDMVAVPIEMPVSEVVRIASEKAVTKLPVYENSIEQIVGVVHVLDLLNALYGDGNDQALAGDIDREILFVPETILASDLLRQFRDSHTHIAIVLDEYGGTAGLITLEDLLDEIIGEIQGPFDIELPPIQMGADGLALIDGRTLIEDVNEYFSLDLIEPNYHTIAGYVLGRLGYIPQNGETVEDEENGIWVRVEKMDRRRIAQVSMARK